MTKHETTQSSIRVAAGHFNNVLPADMIFARQLGVSGVNFNALELDDKAARRVLGLSHRINGSQRDYWDYDDLCRLREFVGGYDLEIESMENVPHRMMSHIKAADAHRDEQLDNYCKTIENLGRAGIPMLGYDFMLLPVVRTTFSAPTRGDALTSYFDLKTFQAENTFDAEPVSAEELWDRYATFVKRVVPVAESAGVKLAMHPDDPPLPELGGITRNFSTKAAFERALAIVDSPNHGLNFCIGTFSEAGVETMYETLDHFTSAGKVFCVHFRNIRHQGDSFIEVFLDDGEVDVVRTMWILVDNGFDGFIMDDHVPQMVGDSGWRHRGRAFNTGYIKGLLTSMRGSDARRKSDT